VAAGDEHEPQFEMDIWVTSQPTASTHFFQRRSSFLFVYRWCKMISGRMDFVN
jgi:hypothetical protein